MLLFLFGVAAKVHRDLSVSEAKPSLNHVLNLKRSSQRVFRPAHRVLRGTVGLVLAFAAACSDGQSPVRGARSRSVRRHQHREPARSPRPASTPVGRTTRTPKETRPACITRSRTFGSGAPAARA